MKAPTLHSSSSAVLANTSYRSLRFLLLLLLFIASCSSSLVAAKNPVPSVQPLQSGGRTFCTVFSISEDEGNWATAAHCAIAAAQLEAISVNGYPAYFAYVDGWTDTAVFKSELHAPALKLATKTPDICRVSVSSFSVVALKECETISIVGYPYGITRTVTRGTVAARNIPIFHPTFDRVVVSDILDITVAGGNSGSPVLNARGEVFGVLWGGFVDSPHALSIPLESIRRSLSAFWQR